MTDTLLLKRLRRLESEVAYLKTLERVVPETMFTSAILSLPGLRGFWPMSSVRYSATNRAADLSVQANDLTATSIPTFGVASNKIPYAKFVIASGQYLSKLDGGAGNWADITGSEVYIDATTTPTSQGLTMGGWFYPTSSASGAAEGLMSKWYEPTNNRSYLLDISWGANVCLGAISNTGATSVTVTSTVTPVVNQWHFVVMRWVPSSVLSIFVNGVRTDNSTAIPATIFDSTADFEIGRVVGGGPTNYYYEGLASMCFLCATRTSNTLISMLYELSRDIYGV